MIWTLVAALVVLALFLAKRERTASNEIASLRAQITSLKRQLSRR